jgi:hypothetical protein
MATDIDNDMRPDIVLGNFDSDNIMVYFNTMEADCHYMPGDINSDGFFAGSDITYAVNYLKGGGMPPPDTCTCVWHGFFYPAADINGDCHVNGIDVIYGVSYFRGEFNLPVNCLDCPPEN